MLGVVILVLLIIGIMLWHNIRVTSQEPDPDDLLALPPTREPSVVGPLIDPDMSDLTLASFVSYGPTDLHFPVGTLLSSSAPENVQHELLTSIPIAPVGPAFELPESFDAREKWPDSITQAYQQGECGSCWAFASALAVSDRLRIVNPEDEHLRRVFMYRPFSMDAQYPVMNNLSPYQLVVCDTCSQERTNLPLATSYQAGGPDTTCNHGCEGGFLEVVYDYLNTTGVTTLLDTNETCDPLSGDCPCRSEDKGKRYTSSRIYSLVAPDESLQVRKEKVMRDLYLRGPVTIGYVVYESFYDFFNQNPTGVYSDRVRPPNDRPTGGHAVDIVGWGTEESTGVFYWLIRNSWGAGWGDNGYFRMQFDLGDAMENVVAGDVTPPE